MFFPRNPGKRRRPPEPRKSAQPANPSDELRPDLKLSKLELMALLLIR